MKRGFTLIEIIIVIAVTAVLSTIILFGITQYINKGKDSGVIGNMATLIPAGEVYYYSGNTYNNFCDSDSNSALKNILSQMPKNLSGLCEDNEAGLCCNVSTNGKAWAACAKKFSSSPKPYYCVDSRGVQEETDQDCSDLTQCP